MAAKFTRREVLFSIGTLIASACTGIGSEPLPAGVDDSGIQRSIEDILANAPVEPYDDAEPKG
jgi:hypothetical protein